jgi:hypothetical protein
MSEIPETTPVKAVIAAKRVAKYEFQLYPQLWERSGYAKVMKKVKWNRVFFEEANRPKVPKEAGIYMFVVAPRHAYLRDHTYIFYVGQADDLHRRYKEYLDEELGDDLAHDRERIVEFLNYFKGHLFFNYFTCAPNDLTKREYYLVDHIYPWANSRHQKEARGKLVAPVNV